MWTCRAVLLFITVVVSGLMGCGASGEDPMQESSLATVHQEASRGNERPPPNGMNGTSPACFWATGTQQALRALGGAGLDQGAGELPNIPLSQVSQTCRKVLRSAIECALTPDQSVHDPVTDEVYSGWWGLSPSWLGDALAPVGRRYVTACMAQRLNFYGVSVPILLEGAQPAIARDMTYDPLYPVAESTAFGDLFSSTTSLLGALPAFNLYVCWESTLPRTCGSTGLPLLFQKRICADSPLCGLVVMGPCSLSCVDSNSYWICQPNLLAAPWKETIRVKLENDTCQ